MTLAEIDFLAYISAKDLIKSFVLKTIFTLTFAFSLYAQTTNQPEISTTWPPGNRQNISDAAPDGEIAADSRWHWDIGADLRLRWESFGNLPSAPLNSKDHRDYFRIRTRAWFELGYENITLYTRIVNEFRKYNRYTPAMKEADPRNPWGFPDELALDNLYIDITGLMDGKLDLRIGRQDLAYGAGRVIFEGTPCDGARTFYFDAIKAVLHITPETTLDGFLIYMDPEGHDDLALGPKDRDLTGNFAPRTTEKGGGLYLKCNEVEELPFELYYVYKREGIDRINGIVPGRDTHTVGARLMPQFSKTLCAELEGAIQFGEIDATTNAPSQRILAYMGYAGATYKPKPEWKSKPYITLACYYLSGDKPGTPGKDNRWNPVWSRYQQFSEMFVLSYPSGRYSNLVYPHFKLGANWSKRQILCVQGGPMYCAEENRVAPNDHSYQGFFLATRYDFPLLKGAFGKRSELYGHITGNLFIPADENKGYYLHDDYGYFLRAEITASF